MSFEEQLKGDREDTTVELERNIDLFCIVQVERISIKGENSRRKPEALLRARYHSGCFTFALSLDFLSELLKLPLSPLNR